MTKVNVSNRALEGRVNRALKKDGETLKKCRQDSRWFSDLGEYYAVNIELNSVSAKHVDLEVWAKELGVLKDYEKLEV
jgi:hypothetical protein